LDSGESVGDSGESFSREFRKVPDRRLDLSGPLAMLRLMDPLICVLPIFQSFEPGGQKFT
jgi:hypothetical protein